jgi:hypothetical protein
MNLCLPAYKPFAALHPLLALREPFVKSPPPQCMAHASKSLAFLFPYQPSIIKLTRYLLRRYDLAYGIQLIFFDKEYAQNK